MTGLGEEPTEDVEDLRLATALLIGDVRGLDESAVRAASLLPDWSRGHVLAHLAQNAAGGTRMLAGVRTGIPGREYVSLDARASDIEDGSHASADALAEAVATTAGAFAQACTRLSPREWSVPVVWTTGQQAPAFEVVVNRLFEVQIHHVDLDVGYSVADWPIDFTTRAFDIIVGAYASRTDLEALTIEVVGTSDRRSIGTGPSSTLVGGSLTGVVTWLLGRSGGTDLVVQGSNHLPALPALY